jgi:hypothetical protein
LFSAAIAPTGQIVVLSECTVGAYGCGLVATFLTPASDAGVGLGGGVGLQVERSVLVASSANYNPQVIWSNASDSFVISNVVGHSQIVLYEYTADGAAAGGVSAVPTDSTTVTENIRASAGVSGNLVGVPFLSSLTPTEGYPGLTVLNLEGAQVGSSIYVANAALAGNTASVSIAMAGTPQGFVEAFTEPSSTLVAFVPTSSSGIVTDGGGFPTMTLAGGPTGGAGLLAVGDNVGTGGANGVGLALQYSTTLSFAYVSADGSQVLGPTSVFTYTPYPNGFSITNYNGSTVLTLSGAAANGSAQIAASGCH